MANPSGQCPFLIPVMADGLWMYPVSAYCRRPDAPVKLPARGTLTRMCTTCEHARCPGFQTSFDFEEVYRVIGRALGNR
jgi:hypothetical protein